MRLFRRGFRMKFASELEEVAVRHGAALVPALDRIKMIGDSLEFRSSKDPHAVVVMGRNSSVMGCKFVNPALLEEDEES